MPNKVSVAVFCRVVLSGSNALYVHVTVAPGPTLAGQLTLALTPPSMTSTTAPVSAMESTGCGLVTEMPPVTPQVPGVPLSRVAVTV